ncbi:MAG: hypothetical protein KGQ49_06480 [Verrucomicrobia bacterium]|nr:hypothetical protein [Verrucomicrobiota bacterium]
MAGKKANVLAFLWNRIEGGVAPDRDRQAGSKRDALREGFQFWPPFLLPENNGNPTELGFLAFNHPNGGPQNSFE